MKATEKIWRYVVGILFGIALSFLLAYAGNQVTNFSGTAWEIPSLDFSSTFDAALRALRSDLESEATLLRTLYLLVEHASALVGIPILLAVLLVRCLPLIAAKSTDDIVYRALRNYVFIALGTFLGVTVIAIGWQHRYQILHDHVLSSVMQGLNWFAVLSLTGSLPCIALLLAVIEVIMRHGPYATTAVRD